MKRSRGNIGVEDAKYILTPVATLDATSNNSYSSNDIPWKISVEEISKKRKVGPTLRSQKKARRQSFSNSKILSK